jgi:septal ring factor EnvC (AmiA/AmiB activator)
MILLLLGCSMDGLHAQKKPSKANLQEQAKKLETQIQYNNKLLEETSTNKTSSLNQLSLLNAQLNEREQLIKTINSEISVVNDDIIAYENQIVALEKEIKNLKTEYAKLVVATQRHMNSSEKLMFIVASESFNQAYRRIKYFQQYSAHRKKQVVLIRQKQEDLTILKNILEQEKNVKTQLLGKEQQEKNNLDAEKTKKNQTISDLQKRERQLREEIRKDQAEAQKLSKQIETLIAQEIEAARKVAAKKAQEEAAKKSNAATTATTATPPKTPSKPSTFDVAPLTPEEKKMSDDFVSNRGKLPWPTERGVITEHFGTHEHSLYKGVMINNDGIDITTGQDEAVRAVFHGIVMGVYPSPYGDAKTLIISHGNYRTVYINLNYVSVKAGQKVTTKQQVGVVNTHGNQTVLKFQLWKDLEKLNPEQWISK